jgi:hypothetical protein
LDKPTSKGVSCTSVRSRYTILTVVYVEGRKSVWDTNGESMLLILAAFHCITGLLLPMTLNVLYYQFKYHLLLTIINLDCAEETCPRRRWRYCKEQCRSGLRSNSRPNLPFRILHQIGQRISRGTSLVPHYSK